MNIVILKILKKCKLLPFLNIVVNKTLYGKRFVIPLLGGIGYEHLYAEEGWMIELLQKTMPLSQGSFVDVGVNSGQTLLKIKSLDPNFLYFGFEPNPACNFYTQRLIEVNHFKNTNIFPVAIHQNSGIQNLHFYGNSKSDPSASILQNFRPGEKVTGQSFIASLSLEDIEKTQDLGAMGFLKIDVEGAEWEVLESFYNKIEKDKPLIIMEILPVYSVELAERMERQSKIKNILLRLEYTMFRIIKKEGAFITLFEVTEIGIHGNMELCNYIMVPNYKKETVLSVFIKA